jgi:hypothetical protein
MVRIHANEVRQCRGCLQRIVWLENAWKRRSAFNVPDAERGKSWLSINSDDRHDCPRKDRLQQLKEKTGRV